MDGQLTSTIREVLEKYMRDASAKRLEMLETFAAAFIGESGLLPSEMELVERTEGNSMVWFFRKREPIPEHDDAAWHPDDDWLDKQETEIKTN